MTIMHKHKRLMPRSTASKVLLPILLLFGCPAFADSYLIVNFSNGVKGSMPKRLALVKRKLLGPQRLGVRREYKTVHLAIKTNPAILPFNTGRYFIDHLDFTKHKMCHPETTYFPKLDFMLFKPDTIYYLGDITFEHPNLIAKSAIDAIQPLCAQNAQLQAATEIFYVFNRTEPIKIENPCEQK